MQNRPSSDYPPTTARCSVVAASLLRSCRGSAVVEPLASRRVGGSSVCLLLRRRLPLRRLPSSSLCKMRLSSVGSQSTRRPCYCWRSTRGAPPNSSGGALRSCRRRGDPSPLREALARGAALRRLPPSVSPLLAARSRAGLLSRRYSSPFFTDLNQYLK